MTPAQIIAIVEGDGEVEAVPVLIRRYAELCSFQRPIHAPPAIRSPASRLRRPGELERTVTLAARRIAGAGGILLVLDSDDDCPATMGPSLLARIRSARSDIPSAVVLAHREFESWFLGAAASLANRRGLHPSLSSHPTPESVRGCKEWLSDHMEHGRVYRPVDDQPALAQVFDLEMARRACPSFDKFHREMTGLLARVAAMDSSLGDSTSPPVSGAR